MSRHSVGTSGNAWSAEAMNFCTSCSSGVPRKLCPSLRAGPSYSDTRPRNLNLNLGYHPFGKVKYVDSGDCGFVGLSTGLLLPLRPGR